MKFGKLACPMASSCREAHRSVQYPMAQPLVREPPRWRLRPPWPPKRCADAQRWIARST